MTSAKIALLPDRGVISVTGPDAAKLLQGVITNDMDQLASQPAIHAALLTPQGKILVDFFVVKTDDGFLLDVPAAQKDDLVKRLKMYRLRAKAEIADASADHAVFVLWGDGANSPGETRGSTGFDDPRGSQLGRRILAERRFADDIASATNGTLVTAADYHAHRIALGVPEGGKDYAFGDTFPHEALLDQLHGVSFSKGCYVGQEIVSRMEHRGTARKRVVPVEADAALPTPGTAVRAEDPVNGSQLIGVLGSTDGSRGLALLRLDRAAELEAKGARLTAANGPLRIAALPAWATFSYPPKTATADH